MGLRRRPDIWTSRSPGGSMIGDEVLGVTDEHRERSVSTLDQQIEASKRHRKILNTNLSESEPTES